MKEIPLSKGKVALVDDEDYERLAQHKWTLLTSSHAMYAGRRLKDEKRTAVSMHREIMYAPAGIEVDHRDHNGLNNQKSNLRLATHQQNSHNRRITIRNTSGYKGVTRGSRNAKKWQASIGHQGRWFCLGRFALPEDAARAYDAKAKELFGEFAQLNFPLEQGAA